ncbi:sugar-binding transcriptional regulator [Catenisphaera adipataccumulans]|jgi:DNA-binding transcriptional regulator LsrR (DeoR family)|uniref:DNA-binding transcriptional regulator LsrR (DeoR family) n=1 Tax=Catenisphaera adipataccumulans TaxID=700500 RepID=A0A7W8CWU6_9FIRM|nr:sugar-binding transcriptional regulator [Catenisphaera adipataccumulans]MBB5183043.1 DNA-binding transcriptional regulator LsrR (DeoR family) [Catenisphaera adipataccumulans]
MKDERFIYKVVEMYYKRGMSQQQIGKALNVSRTTIFRALEKARDEGYVQIKINRPNDSLLNIEEQIEKKYGLKEVIIVYDRADSDIKSEVGYYTSDYILRSLHNGMKLAFSRGTTLQRTVEYMEKDMRLRSQKYKDLEILPMQGSSNRNPTNDQHYRFSFTNYLIDRIALLLDCSGYSFLAPIVASSAEVRDILMNEPCIQEVLERTRQADMAVTGIGTLGPTSNIMNDPMVTRQDREDIMRKGGIGEISGHILDEHGELVNCSYEHKMIGISAEDMKKIPLRVGAACGEEKKEIILSTLLGHFVNVLITDEKVARYLLEYQE